MKITTALCDARSKAVGKYLLHDTSWFGFSPWSKILLSCTELLSRHRHLIRTNRSLGLSERIRHVEVTWNYAVKPHPKALIDSIPTIGFDNHTVKGEAEGGIFPQNPTNRTELIPTLFTSGHKPGERPNRLHYWHLGKRL
jgi:hypothetical protein